MAAKAVVRDVGRVLDLRLQLLRPARQADPVPARQAHHARRCARDGAAARRAREEGRGGARAARAGRAARGPDAQRRHARRRRADRAGQAHRLLPAVRRRGHRQRRVAVRQGRRRGGRPGEVRLPRPDHAHHPRLDGALHRAARSGEPKHRSLGADSARRRGGLPDLRQRQHHRGVPVRIARHARPAQAGAARPLRGHHRAGRAVPARARWT